MCNKSFNSFTYRHPQLTFSHYVVHARLRLRVSVCRELRNYVIEDVSIESTSTHDEGDRRTHERSVRRTRKIFINSRRVNADQDDDSSSVSDSLWRSIEVDYWRDREHEVV